METSEKDEKLKHSIKVNNERLKKVKEELLKKAENEKPCGVLLGKKYEFLSFNTNEIKKLTLITLKI